MAVGSSTIAYDGTSRAFAYYGGAMHDLGTLGGDQSAATAINDANFIAGTAASGIGFLDALVDLSTSDFSSLLTANAISDSGYIVGKGVTAGGQTHAFLLSPVPSPPS